MENSEIVIALLGLISSVITSVIAGYYAVRVSQIEQKRSKNKPVLKAEGETRVVSGPSYRLGMFILYSVTVPVVSTFALLGNWISGTPNELLIPDTLDSAIISPAFLLISFAISAKLFLEKTDVRRIIVPAVIIGLLIMPFIYLLGFILNLALSPEIIDLQFKVFPDTQTLDWSFNIGVSVDAMIMGGLTTIAGFLLGASKKDIVFSLR